MTSTGRCRRHHQGTCEGRTTKGLCTKHRRIWEAMVKDWQARAAQGAATTPTPPQALWLPSSVYTGDGARQEVEEGWYFDHHACHTTTGPLTQEAAQQLVDTHPDGCARKRPQRKTRSTTHCKAGHPFTPENTTRKKDGYRGCRTCRNRWSREYRERDKERAPTGHFGKESKEERCT